jgi:hypothetical protein
MEPFSKSREVFFHEFTHYALDARGVLNSPGEPSIIHEGLSDIFAKLISYGNTPLNPKNWDWVLGRELFPDLPSELQGVRNLDDPKIGKCDYDNYNDFCKLDEEFATKNSCSPKREAYDSHSVAGIVSLSLANNIKLSGVERSSKTLWGAVGILGAYSNISRLRRSYFSQCINKNAVGSPATVQLIIEVIVCIAADQNFAERGIPW